MANEANTLSTQRTIREYLSDMLTDTDTKIGLIITLNGANARVYEVDLLWSGQEYLISYKANSDSTTLPIVKRLVDVLPITFEKTTNTPS